MTIKTLLLGSVAAVAVVGGAQAADLSVAEPVEYVKVCDYFGTGYWYIPGTDTCIKISGFIESTANFFPNHLTGTSHSSTWDFGIDAMVDVDTKSETEYGVLEGLMSIQTSGSTYSLGEDGAFISLGGFKTGAYQIAAWNAAYTTANQGDALGAQFNSTLGYDLLHTAQFSWNAGGVSASIALSDPSSSAHFGNGSFVAAGSPLVTGNIGFSGKNMSLGVAGGFIQDNAGSSWGVDVLANFNPSKADRIVLTGAYGDNAFIQNGAFASGVNTATNNGYSLLAGWQHSLTPTLAFALTGSYAKYSGTSVSGSAFTGDLIWTPVTNLTVTGVVVYSTNTGTATTVTSAGTWGAQIDVRKSW